MVGGLDYWSRGHVYREIAPSNVFGGILQWIPSASRLDGGRRKWILVKIGDNTDKRGTRRRAINASSSLSLLSSLTLVFYPPNAVPLSQILDILLSSTGHSTPDFGHSVVLQFSTTRLNRLSPPQSKLTILKRAPNLAMSSTSYSHEYHARCLTSTLSLASSGLPQTSRRPPTALHR